MKARTSLVAALALLLLAPVTACKKSSTSEASGGASGPKVAFLLATLQEERYQKDKRYFEERARALGVTPFTLAADNENARQLAQVEDALSRGARVLVIQPTDSAAAGAYVALARKKGAKVVAYDRGIAGDSPDAYVAHDSFRVGALLAEAAVAATSGKGNYVILQGQSGHSVAVEIARGFKSVLDPYVQRGDVHIVLEKNHDAWSPEQALKSVEDALTKTKGDVQAILAANSGMARGAVQAMRASASGGRSVASGERGVFVGGADADAANVNFVCEGKQSVEVLKDIKPLAERAAEVAKAFATGESPQGGTPDGRGVPVFAVPVHLVTRDNARALLVESGFHTESAVPACVASVR